MTAQALHTLTPFSDDVTQAQSTFRLVLKAMSEPAQWVELNSASPDQTSLDKNITALWHVAQTVLDGEVSAYFSNAPIAGRSPLSERLAPSAKFFTGVQLMDDVTKADYVFAPLNHITQLGDIKHGTLEEPHISATVVLLVEDDAPEMSLRVSGPGVDGSRSVSISGLTTEMLHVIQENHQRYPCAVDWVFCSNNKVMALPRTSQVQVEG